MDRETAVLGDRSAKATYAGKIKGIGTILNVRHTTDFEFRSSSERRNLGYEVQVYDLQGNLT